MEMIKAIPVAALVPPRWRVGRLQNTGWLATSPGMAIQNASRVSTGVLITEIDAKASVPTASMQVATSRWLLCLSAYTVAMRMATMVHSQGIISSSPTEVLT